MKTRRTKKQGISLIVLVITIIVMIILAAAIILSLSSNGIIGKANNAVKESNLTQVQIVAQTIWSDVYLENLEKKDGEKLDYQTEVINRLKAQKIDTDKYNIKAGKNGVTVRPKEEQWTAIYEGTTPTKTQLLIATKNLFVANARYRITVEGLGQVETTALDLGEQGGSQVYALIGIDNGKLIGVESMEDYQQKYANASEDAVYLAGIYSAESSACAIMFQNATTEYIVTKIETNMPVELQEYILGEDGKGRAVSDTTFITITNEIKGTFVDNSVIKDASTSIEVLGVDLVQGCCAVIRYKDQTYKVYIDNYVTKQMEVYTGTDVGEAYMLIKDYYYVIYKNQRRIEAIAFEGNGKSCVYYDSTFEINGNKIVTNDGVEITINDNDITVSGKTYPKTNLVLFSYCEHEGIIDSEGNPAKYHICTKCGIYGEHTDREFIGGDYVLVSCKYCDYEYVCSHEPESWDDFGECICKYCGQTYYDSKYDMHINGHTYNCDERGMCYCEYCDDYYYDPDYDTSYE